MSLADPILRTTFSALAGVPAHTPTLTMRGNIAYVQTHYLPRALPALAAQHRCVLVTHGSDAAADDAMAKKIPPNVAAWYSMNATGGPVMPLPIGLRSDTDDELLDLMRRAIPQKDRMGNAFLCATWDNLDLPEFVRSERRDLYARFEPATWVTTRGGGSIGDVPFDRFINYLCEHRYVLCPRGAGYDSHRLWEAMYMGAIPIVRRSQWTDHFARYDPPWLLVNCWSQVTPDLLDLHYEPLRDKLINRIEPLAASFWLEQIEDACTIR